MNQALEEEKKTKPQFERIQNSSGKNSFYAFTVLLLGPEKEDNVSSADAVCDHFMTNIFPDATSYLSKVFVTGPMVVRFQEASGIPYHELGHKFFHFMKNSNKCKDKSWFEKTRACLLSNHTELSSEEMAEQTRLLQTGEQTKYESEDWADMISSQSDERANNYACLFAEKMRVEDYRFLTLRNGQDSDPHSSDLFRLLHLNFLKNGKVPGSCLKALFARGEKLSFKNCFTE